MPPGIGFAKVASRVHSSLVRHSGGGGAASASAVEPASVVPPRPVLLGSALRADRELIEAGNRIAAGRQSDAHIANNESDVPDATDDSRSPPCYPLCRALIAGSSRKQNRPTLGLRRGLTKSSWP